MKAIKFYQCSYRTVDKFDICLSFKLTMTKAHLFQTPDPLCFYPVMLLVISLLVIIQVNE